MASRRIVVLGLVACAALSRAASAQIYVFPGDTVNLPTPISNTDENGNPGGATISSIKLTVSPLSGFVTSATDSSTESLAPGEVETFTPSFVVDPTAADGTYTVTLQVVSSDTGIDPDPSSSASNIQVTFTIYSTASPQPTAGNHDGDSSDGTLTPNDCLVIQSSAPGVGIQALGWSGSSNTATFPQGTQTASDVTNACNLSSGTITLYAENWAGNVSSSTITVSSAGPQWNAEVAVTEKTTSLLRASGA